MLFHCGVRQGEERDKHHKGIFTDDTAVQKSGEHGIVAAIPVLGTIQKNPIHSA